MSLSPASLVDHCSLEVSTRRGLILLGPSCLEIPVLSGRVLVIAAFGTLGLPHVVHASPGPLCLGSLVTLIRHPSEFMNVPLHQQQNKCTTLVKNKTAAAATALQFTCPLFTANACSAAGGSSLSQTQVSDRPVTCCAFVRNGFYFHQVRRIWFSFIELNNF